MHVPARRGYERVTEAGNFSRPRLISFLHQVSCFRGTGLGNRGAGGSPAPHQHNARSKHHDGWGGSNGWPAPRCWNLIWPANPRKAPGLAKPVNNSTQRVLPPGSLLARSVQVGFYLRDAFINGLSTWGRLAEVSRPWRARTICCRRNGVTWICASRDEETDEGQRTCPCHLDAHAYPTDYSENRSPNHNQRSGKFR